MYSIKAKRNEGEENQKNGIHASDTFEFTSKRNVGNMFLCLFLLEVWINCKLYRLHLKISGDMKSKLVHAEMQTCITHSRFFSRMAWKWMRAKHAIAAFEHWLLPCLKYDSIIFSSLFPFASALWSIINLLLVKQYGFQSVLSLSITPHLSLKIWIINQRKWEMKVIVTS